MADSNEPSTRQLIKIRDVTEVPGAIVRGSVPLLTLPTMTSVSLPVVIASGQHDGISPFITVYYRR